MLDRELSRLNFDARILELAEDPSIPVLERIRFLYIVACNIDDFFQIRVAGLMQQAESATHHATREYLLKVLARARELMDAEQRCWKDQLVPALAAQGIAFKSREQLSETEREELSPRFDADIFSALTPLAFDPSHPFPVLTNKGLYLLVLLQDPVDGDFRRAVVPIPRVLPRVLAVGQGPTQAFTLLGHVVKLFIHRLFEGLELKGCWAFRITRNTDLYADEEAASNLLESIEEDIRKRRYSAPVRLEIDADVPEDEMQWLLRATELSSDHAFRLTGPVDLLRLVSLLDLVFRPDLLFQPFVPFLPPDCAHPAKLFSRIAQQDLLLHHPYDSFTPVVDFVREAARDESVVAIKLTLYRTSGDSPFIEALSVAARNGKQVTALIELRARFDELNNIEWARKLEDAGAHVVYGLAGLKTHCQVCLVIRQEKRGLRRYAHLGTGNYNPRSARVNTDFSLFTADEQVTADVGLLFNVLTGNLAEPNFTQLLVAPFDLSRRIIQLIDAEAEAAKAGRKASIFAKVNNLADSGVISALYRASAAGVQVDLLVRRVCCLVPGAPGLSENIRVRSIVGRFLEHSRLFRFENSAGEPVILMGSADLMQRNLRARVECVFPVRNKALRDRVEKEIIATFCTRQGDAKSLKADGTFVACCADGRLAPGAQDAFLALAARRGGGGADGTEQPNMVSRL